jgi:hypothetical protein
MHDHVPCPRCFLLPPGCAPCAARDEEIAQLQERLAARDAEVTGLRDQIAARDAEVADLTDRVTWLERAVSRNSGNSSMPPSGDDTPGRKPPRKQRRAAERAVARKRRRGKQPGAPGPAMTWGVPDDTRDYHPEGACSCGADLADAADLGVSRSYQQKEVPEPEAVTIQHDLHETRCACGKTHVAPARRPGLRGPDRAAAGGTGGLPAGLPAPARGPVPDAAVRHRGRGGVCRVHPLLPAQGHVDGRRDRQADQDPAHRLQGCGLRPNKTQQKVSGRLTSDDTTQARRS